MPNSFLRIVCNLYRDNITIIEDREVEIPMSPGVKQGDSLSLLLFNVVVDELLDRLSRSPDGIQLADGRTEDGLC